MNRFCPICGKPTDELIDNFCKDCFVKERVPVSLPERLEGVICRNCLKHRRQGKWVHLSSDWRKVLEKASVWEMENGLVVKDLDSLKVSTEIENIDEPSPNKFILPMRVNLKGKVKGVPLDTEAETVVEITAELCPNCSRMSGRYYEAVLQIRGPEGRGINRKTLKALEDEIELQVEQFGKEDGKSFITEIGKLKEGKDYYLGSKKVARKIARSLKGLHGGEIKETSTLVGQKDGRPLTRATVLFRLPKV